MYPPPPPYVPSRPSRHQGITALPLHLLHRILLLTLDQRATPSKFWTDAEEERVRRIWALFRGLRGVNRVFWLVSTSILRAMYLETYLSHIKPGYSSDPFPSDISTIFDPSVSSHLGSGTTDAGSVGVYDGRGRETAVFDRFIAVKIGEELREVESALSEGSEAVGDIFNRLQPAARIEDLLLTLPDKYITPALPAHVPGPGRSLPLPQTHLSVTLTPTWAGLYLHSAPVPVQPQAQGKRASRELVIEVRRRDTLEGTLRMVQDGLDDIARRLVPWGGRVG